MLIFRNGTLLLLILCSPGNVADLLAESSLKKREADFASVIQHSSQNLLFIIIEILDFSKIEAGKIDFHPEAFDLSQLLFRM